MTNELSQKKEEYLQRYLSGLEPGISKEEIIKRRKALNFEMRDAGMPPSWRKSAVETFTAAARIAHEAPDVDWDEVDTAMKAYAEKVGLNSSDEEEGVVVYRPKDASTLAEWADRTAVTVDGEPVDFAHNAGRVKIISGEREGTYLPASFVETDEGFVRLKTNDLSLIREENPELAQRSTGNAFRGYTGRMPQEVR